MSRSRKLAITVPALLVLGLTAFLMLIMAGASSTQSSTGLPSSLALSDIPPAYLQLYLDAGAKYQTDWWMLAGIGKIETDHGRSTAAGVHSGVNAYGCCAGPMQFAVSTAAGCRVCVGDTWGSYGVDGNHDGTRDVYDPADAIPGAARYTNANGAPTDWHRALLRYNQSEAYYLEVMQWADKYHQASEMSPIAGFASPQDVASNPNVLLHSACQRADLLGGRIDPRVVTVIATTAQQHKVGISSLKCDHSPFTSSGNLSNHGFGRAVDISDVDGEACTGTRTGNCGRLVVQLARLRGPLHSTELIYCFDPDGAASGDAFAASDHCDHIHLGFNR